MWPSSLILSSSYWTGCGKGQAATGVTQLPSFSKEIAPFGWQAVAFTSVLLGFSAVTQHTVTLAGSSLLQSPVTQAWQRLGP